jgi:hypothetical protein
MKNSEISLYVDSLIAEIIIADGIITKTASGSKINEMASKISSFFTPQFDNASDFGDKAVNFLGFIAPGAIFLTFRKLNMPWIGALLGLAASMFRVPVKEVLASIYNSISNAISGGKKLTSGQVDSIVGQSVNSGMASSAPEIESEDSENFDLSSFNSLNMTLRQAKLIKLAMLQEQDNLYKFALGRPSLSPSKKPFFTKFAFGSILRSVLSWFFKIALASAGFMVAGDVVNSLIGRHSDSLSDKFVTDDKIKRQYLGKEPGSSKLAPSSYLSEEPKNISGLIWSEPYRADKFSIPDMLIDFAEEVYPGSKEKEDIIRSSPSFIEVVNKIIQHNLKNIGSGITMLPMNYHSKKEVVDSFIHNLSNASIVNSRSYQSNNDYLSYKRNSPTLITNKISYPIVISDKWKSRMNESQSNMLSKLTTDEQKKVEAYLDSLSMFELLKINNMSEEEKVAFFKKNVKEQLGEDAYQRVITA